MKTSEQAKIATIVLTWNSSKFIEECLDNLIRSNTKTSIFVVDNNSLDNTCEIVKTRYPDVTLLETGKNLGYAGGNNFAIKKLADKHFEYFFVLNPDAYVANDCINLLLRRMNQEKVLAAVSPIIYYQEPSVIWYAGSTINWKNGTTPHIGYGEIDDGQYNSVKYTNRVNGCAMLIRNSCIDAVGLMDDKYFLYFEETDWSVRFLDAGFKLGLVPNAKVWHITSASTGGLHSPIYEYYMTRNRLYFMHKFKANASKIYFLRILYKMHYDLYAIATRHSLSNALTVAKYQYLGLWDYLTNSFGYKEIK